MQTMFFCLFVFLAQTNEENLSCSTQLSTGLHCMTLQELKGAADLAEHFTFGNKNYQHFFLQFNAKTVLIH